jgi:nucleoside-diphosphate-sugar epimerase
MVLPTFVRQALEESPITIHGDGKQSRCFCDVRDTVEAVTRLVDTLHIYISNPLVLGSRESLLESGQFIPFHIYGICAILTL